MAILYKVVCKFSGLGVPLVGHLYCISPHNHGYDFCGQFANLLACKDGRHQYSTARSCVLLESLTLTTVCRGLCICTYICIYVRISVVVVQLCMYSISDCSQDSMCRMTQLTELDLKNNRLSVLPGMYVRMPP